MTRKSIFAICAAALGVGLVAPLLWPHRNVASSGSQTLAISPGAVTLHYLEERTADGRLSGQPTFLVSNGTTKPLAISLSAVEVRSGSRWVPFTNFSGAGCWLQFAEEPGKPAKLVGPCREEAGSVERYEHVALPQAVPWRVRAFVHEKLDGPRSPSELVADERRMLELRFRYGITNVPLHPFPKNLSRYRSIGQVVSEEVLLPPVVNASARKTLPTEPAAVLPAAQPEAIARAREAMRRKLSELPIEETTGQPTAGPLKSE